VNNFSVEGLNVLVCGMARSGQAAAVLLNDLGANITITDKKTDLDFDYKSKGIEAYLGKNPDDIVQNFDLIIISPGISIYTEFVQKAEHLGIPVWGEAELAYRLCPCYMVAITGTNGKTTVTTLENNRYHLSWRNFKKNKPRYSNCRKYWHPLHGAC